MADSLLEKYCSLDSIGYNGRNTYWRQNDEKKGCCKYRIVRFLRSLR